MLPSQHHLGRIQYEKRTCCALAILLPTVWNSPRGAFDTSGWPGLAACALRARAAVRTAIDAYMVSKGRYGSRLNEKTKGYLVWGLAAKGEGQATPTRGAGRNYRGGQALCAAILLSDASRPHLTAVDGKCDRATVRQPDPGRATRERIGTALCPSSTLCGSPSPSSTSR